MHIIKDKDAGDREYVITIEDKEGIRVRQESLPPTLSSDPLNLTSLIFNMNVTVNLCQFIKRFETAERRIINKHVGASQEKHATENILGRNSPR